QDHHGPARTFTPVDLWDVRLVAGATATLQLPEGHTAALAILRGEVGVGAEHTAREGQLAIMSRTGAAIALTAGTEASILLMSGKPLGEAIAAHGPFVMNTVGEVKQAMRDFQDGKFGVIS
ncbi:MAG: pirin-like C-terminal cupin domain-containing protein, partial [Hyphomicrobium sp.]